MTEPCLLDNDVVLKISAYQLLEETLLQFTIDGTAPAMLGVGRFVLRKKAKRSERFVNTNAVVASVADAIDRLQLVEPTNEEVELAAALEESAIEAGVALDTGEAQLLSVLIKRGSPIFATGDKRATEAITALAPPEITGRLVCLEQIFLCLLKQVPFVDVRHKVCQEPKADKAIASCFSCASIASSGFDPASTREGLRSYIESLRKASGGGVDARSGALSVHRAGKRRRERANLRRGQYVRF